MNFESSSPGAGSGTVEAEYSEKKKAEEAKSEFRLTVLKMMKIFLVPVLLQLLLPTF